MLSDIFNFIFFFFSFLPIQSNWNEITDNFDDMNLKESLLRGIYAYGFEKPSAIQQRAIIPCIKGTGIELDTGAAPCDWVKWCLTIFRDLPNKWGYFLLPYWSLNVIRFNADFCSCASVLCEDALWRDIKCVSSPLGYDVIAQAQSGTGKTATFAISILQQLDIEQKETQALVLAPTRELAQQVCCSWGHVTSTVSQT